MSLVRPGRAPIDARLGASDSVSVCNPPFGRPFGISAVTEVGRSTLTHAPVAMAPAAQNKGEVLPFGHTRTNLDLGDAIIVLGGFTEEAENCLGGTKSGMSLSIHFDPSTIVFGQGRVEVGASSRPAFRLQINSHAVNNK